MQGVGIGKDAHQQHGTGHGQGQSHGKRLARGETQPPQDGHGEQGGGGAFQQGTRDGRAPHRQQFTEIEVEADTEHEQDDAHLGQLVGQVGISP